VYRCSNSSPRYSVRTTMLPLYTIQKFLRFPFYKISITLLLFLLSLGKGCPNPIAKITKILEKSLSLNDFFYFLSRIYVYVRFSSRYFALRYQSPSRFSIHALSAGTIAQEELRSHIFGNVQSCLCFLQTRKPRLLHEFTIKLR